MMSRSWFDGALDVGALGDSDRSSFLKQSLQKTGFLDVGLKGTLVSLPHDAQVTSVIWRSLLPAP